MGLWIRSLQKNTTTKWILSLHKLKIDYSIQFWNSISNYCHLYSFSVGMSLMGVEGAIVLALCASVFNLIPYVGPIIGAALGILLGMGQLYAAGISDPSLTVDSSVIVFVDRACSF